MHFECIKSVKIPSFAALKTIKQDCLGADILEMFTIRRPEYFKAVNIKKKR